MRELTKKEIDDAPGWAVSYCIDVVETGPIVSYHERHYGFTQQIPRKVFDINIGFTRCELLNLIGQIEHLDDCGPPSVGYQSDELMGLISKLKKASGEFK